MSSLLGGIALAHGLGPWDWVALILLFTVGGLVVFVLWPNASYSFRFDPTELLSEYVDNNQRTSMSEMHRALAIRIETDRANNWTIIQRQRLLCRWP